MITKGYNDAPSVLWLLRNFQGMTDEQIKGIDLRIEPLEGEPKATPTYYHGTDLLLFEKMERYKGLVFEPYTAPISPLGNS